MKLKKWLADNGMTSYAFSKVIGAVPSGVWKLANGYQRPNWASMLKIYKATNKEVTPNDFL